MNINSILLIGNDVSNLVIIKDELIKTGKKKIQICTNEDEIIRHILENAIDIVIAWKPFRGKNGQDIMNKIVSRIKCFEQRIEIIIIDSSPYSDEKYSSVFLNAKFIKWGQMDYISNQILNLLG